MAQKGCSGEDMRRFCPSWTDEQNALRAEWLHTCQLDAIRTAYDGFHTDDIHVDLPHLKLPMRVVVAGGAAVIGPDDISEIKTLAPAIDVRVVEKAGHMIPWDDLEGFLAAVLDFRPIADQANRQFGRCISLMGAPDGRPFSVKGMANLTRPEETSPPAVPTWPHRPSGCRPRNRTSGCVGSRNSCRCQGAESCQAYVPGNRQKSSLPGMSGQVETLSAPINSSATMRAKAVSASEFTTTG